MANHIHEQTEAEMPEEGMNPADELQDAEGRHVASDDVDDILPEPAESDVPEPVESDVSELAESDVPEPADSDVPEPVESDVSELAELAVSELAESDVHELADSDIHELVDSDIHELVESDMRAVSDSEALGVDYATFSRKQMMDHLRELLVMGEIETIRRDIDILKYHFYRKLKAEEELSRAEFIENGGSDDDYMHEEDEQELILKSLLNKYREIRQSQNERMEVEKQSNLEKKHKIIEELKELTNSAESIGGTFQQFRDLQNRWRAVGLVPQNEVKNLWDTYYHYVEVFYDYIKINRELRDLDFKRNLESKIELCEKTEALLLEPMVVKAFQTLQTHHEQWREIGPVPKEKRVEIWGRFKTASAQVNKKHQDYFEHLRDTQRKNKEAKEALCVQVDEILERTAKSSSQWTKNSIKIGEIKKIWSTIGHAGVKDNEKLYKRFRSLCNRFFGMRREFANHEREEQLNNLQLKQDLCVQAEALKDSAEWRATTDEFIQLQNRWKEIGSVPQKQQDAVWKRFRKACDYFFNQKTKHYTSVESEYDVNLKTKRALIQQIQQFEHSSNPRETFEQLKDFQRQWSDIGFVPYKHMKTLHDEYRSAINKQFDALQASDGERNRGQYKSRPETGPAASKPRGKPSSERDRLVRRYQQLQGDIVLWENNIGFFSKSKSSAAMVQSVQQMIENGKAEIKELEEKIKLIDSADK